MKTRNRLLLVGLTFVFALVLATTVGVSHGRKTMAAAPLRGCIEGWVVTANSGVGIKDWEITVEDAKGGQIRYTLTDWMGHFQFCDLPMGNYVVRQEMRTGWEAISPSEIEVFLSPADFREELVRLNESNHPEIRSGVVHRHWILFLPGTTTFPTPTSLPRSTPTPTPTPTPLDWWRNSNWYKWYPRPWNEPGPTGLIVM